MIEHVIGAEIKFSGSILEEVSLKPFGNGSSNFTKDRIGNLKQYYFVNLAMCFISGFFVGTCIVVYVYLH